MRQDIHSCFALWSKTYAPGAIFATSRTCLAELVTWQVWTAWLSQL